MPQRVDQKKKKKCFEERIFFEKKLFQITAKSSMGESQSPPRLRSQRLDSDMSESECQTRKKICLQMSASSSSSARTSGSDQWQQQQHDSDHLHRIKNEKFETICDANSDVKCRDDKSESINNVDDGDFSVVDDKERVVNVVKGSGRRKKSHPVRQEPLRYKTFFRHSWWCHLPTNPPRSRCPRNFLA